MGTTLRGLFEVINLAFKISKPGKSIDAPLKIIEGRSPIPWSSWEIIELNGQGLHVNTCLPCEKGHPAPIFWTKFIGVRPSRIGMRRIAVIKNMIFDLSDIEDSQNLVWTCQKEKQHLCQGFPGHSKREKSLMITCDYNSFRRQVFLRNGSNSSTKMSAKEDTKYKFCFWYRLVRKFSTNSLLNDKTVECSVTSRFWGLFLTAGLPLTVLSRS